MSPHLIFEDEYLFAFNKPAGLVINDSDTQIDRETLQSYLDTNYSEYFTESDNLDVTDELAEDSADVDMFYNRTGIVHRLDKDTSGIILVAKTPEAFFHLQQEFKERNVKKEYFAIVYGHIKDLELGEHITINAPIARNPNNREKFAVVRDGKESETLIKLDEKIDDYNSEAYSIVTCYPKTGRTHQIRVHLTALGHPVVGDEQYSGKKRYRKHSELFPRQLLHARRIQFKHPFTKRDLELEAPLPEDIASVLDLIHGRKP